LSHYRIVFQLRTILEKETNYVIFNILKAFQFYIHIHYGNVLNIYHCEKALHINCSFNFKIFIEDFPNLILIRYNPITALRKLVCMSFLNFLLCFSKISSCKNDATNIADTGLFNLSNSTHKKQMLFFYVAHKYKSLWNFPPVEKRAHCFTDSKNVGRSRLHFFQFQGRCSREKTGFLSGRRYFYNTPHSKVAANPTEGIRQRRRDDGLEVSRMSEGL